MDAATFFNRLAQIAVLLLGVSFTCFCLTFLSPGDPALTMLTSGGNRPSPELLEAVREEMGLNRPFLIQYGSWLAGVFKGDLGRSLSSKLPVWQILLDRFPATALLALSSLAIMMVVSLPLGILSAVKRDTWPDYLIRMISFMGISMPGFWVGLMLLYLLGLKLHWFPIASTVVSLKTLVLPSVTLAVSMSSKYVRQVRTAVLQELGEDYVLGARAQGLSETLILWRQVIPNALLPLITILGLSLGSLLGGTAVVEIVFSWPGLGKLAVESISLRDYPLVQGVVLWITLIYMGVNLLVDLSYSWLDPRLRKKRAGGLFAWK
ncbi:MAG: ABC transporter permease [Deltaproteobacteria bacterium]|jgi:peptide/nickel transport system permease protein|nr:ABC transporter permease [Deltaproteobacteria bacterium]